MRTHNFGVGRDREEVRTFSLPHLSQFCSSAHSFSCATEQAATAITGIRAEALTLSLEYSRSLVPALFYSRGLFRAYKVLYMKIAIEISTKDFVTQIVSGTRNLVGDTVQNSAFVFLVYLLPLSLLLVTFSRSPRPPSRVDSSSAPRASLGRLRFDPTLP